MYEKPPKFVIKKFYKKTGMYIDFDQIKNLSNIDTLIDIGVGPNGTKDLYNNFKNANLILIDPIDQAKKYADKLSKKRNVQFFQVSLGKSDNVYKKMKIQKKLGLSSLLELNEFNEKDDYTEIKQLKIQKLDTLLKKKSLGRIGIKIDVEGYELDVILGARETLKLTNFVIAEVRHNHESLIGVYKLHEFMYAMSKNGFTLTKILTAKPFIADLCFEPNKKLFRK